MLRVLTVAIFSFVLLCLLPTDSKADSIVLSTVQQGWYNDEGTNNGVPVVGSNNYFAGLSSGHLYRNYFVFNLTYIRAVTSAHIVIRETGGFKFHPDPYETFTLFDVQTPAEQLGTVAGVSIYNDLGSGTVFGSLNVPYLFQGQYLTIDLNAEALAAINNSHGLFAIGGAITTLGVPPGAEEYLFSASGGFPIQLVVEGQQLPAPEPSTILLLGAGLAGVAQILRRRAS